jgi:hypothetical protein
MPVRASKVPEPSTRLFDVQFKALPIQSIPVANRRRVVPTVHADVMDRVRCEFVEMRGFSPTVEQAARLFHLTREECAGVLKGLVDEGFLRRTPDGRYRLPSQQ